MISEVENCAEFNCTWRLMLLFVDMCHLKRIHHSSLALEHHLAEIPLHSPINNYGRIINSCLFRHVPLKKALANSASCSLFLSCLLQGVFESKPFSLNPQAVYLLHQHSCRPGAFFWSHAVTLQMGSIGFKLYILEPKLQITRPSSCWNADFSYFFQKQFRKKRKQHTVTYTSIASLWPKCVQNFLSYHLVKSVASNQ